MSKPQSIPIDVDVWLLRNGNFELSVFMGENATEPAFISTFHLQEVIEKELQSLVLADAKLADYHFEDVELLLDSLKEAYDYAERRVLELGYEKSDRR